MSATQPKAGQYLDEIQAVIDRMKAAGQPDSHGPTSFDLSSPGGNWKPDYTLNRHVDLDRLGELVKEAFGLFHSPEEDTEERDGLADILSTMYGVFYPGASRVLSHAEYEAMTRRDTFKMLDWVLAGAAEKSPRPELIEDFIIEARDRLAELAKQGA